jgi:hypothetical protein
MFPVMGNPVLPPKVAEAQGAIVDHPGHSNLARLSDYAPTTTTAAQMERSLIAVVCPIHQGQDPHAPRRLSAPPIASSPQTTHSNLRVEVRGTYIVSMRGTSLRAKFRKQAAPSLAMDEYEEDTGALITLQEFRALAWEAANAKARELGWVRSFDEFHEAVKRSGSAA